MEPPNYTKKSAEPARINDLPAQSYPDLHLPDTPDFVPRRPKLDADSFIDLCWKFLPEVLARPGFWEDQKADRCHAEFDLDHPERVLVTYPKELIDEIFAYCENLERQRLASGDESSEFVL